MHLWNCPTNGRLVQTSRLQTKIEHCRCLVGAFMLCCELVVLCRVSYRTSSKQLRVVILGLRLVPNTPHAHIYLYAYRSLGRILFQVKLYNSSNPPTPTFHNSISSSATASLFVLCISTGEFNSNISRTVSSLVHLLNMLLSTIT